VFLCGDVMTGRGIDQILPSPSKPELHECYVNSAVEYVEMARRSSGTIPKAVNFSYIWGDALAELEAVSPAARIINLETSITASDDWVPKGINYRMNPANTPGLAAAKIDCCVLANNHVLDWGRAGLRETLLSLKTAGIGTAGAGMNRTEAVRPCAMEGILVFAFATGDSGVPSDWDATDTAPGIALLPNLSDDTADDVAAEISYMRRPDDIVIASFHWGGNWGYEIHRSQTSFAHRLIDAGAVDIIHGHSSHHPKAIEVYKTKPILYGCGDFLNDYEGIGGFEEFRSHLALMYFVTLDAFTRSLVRLEMTPLEIRQFRLRHASRDDARWLSETLCREGKQFGIRTKLLDDNRLDLEWPVGA
jgi:poly-gamma-glutamate synthesis protein (capsule biosynthesis protein)